jgi:hypothetical protein
MSQCRWLGVLALVGPEFRRMPWLYAVDFGAHSIPSPSSTLQGTSHSSEAQYGMYRVPYLWRTKHTISPFL